MWGKIGGVNRAQCTSDAIASAQAEHPENVGPSRNAPRFDAIMLKTKTVDAKATPAGIDVTFDCGDAQMDEGVEVEPDWATD